MGNAKDDLNSIQVARILDLLSEGEIEGFPSAKAYTWGTTEYNAAMLKDVYFNNTPVLRADASASPQASDYNFDVSTAVFAARKGTQDQSYTDIIGDANQTEYSVNTKILKAVPIARSITNTSVNAVRITLSIPALQIFKKNGDVVGTDVRYYIQTSYGGGTYTTVIDNTISGRSADLYQKVHRIDLTQAPPVNIRVVRVTDDAPPVDTNNTTYNNDLYWSSYTEKINAKTRYPNSALFGLKINAQQFPSIPSRAYRIRGVKVAIPSNATVDSNNGRMIYSGVWDGTFKSSKAWTSDPAWILWDLLTSTRYGFGDHVDASQLDKWTFYSCSQYASALVDSGLRATNGSIVYEPRFSCNVSIQSQEEAFKLISDLCSVMRSMPYWATGSLTLAQDAPTDYAFVFNQSNVTEAGFNYSGSSLKTRHTVVVVSYLDLDMRDMAYEVIEDKIGIDKFGVVKTEITAFACTSRGQARRLGEWILYSEQNETETVTFVADIAAGMTVRPGDVIKISDPSRAGVVRSGRCAAGSTTTSIKLDRGITDIQSNFTLNVMLPDGSIAIVANSNISGTTVTPGTALTQAPSVGAPYSLGDANVQLSTWRVLGIAEQDGHTYAVTALSYNSSKYDYVERSVPLQTRDVSDLNQPPTAPTNVQANEVLYESNGQVQSKIIVGWKQASRADIYEVRYRINSGNYITTTTRAPDAEILNSDVGAYDIQVTAIGASGKRSSGASLAFTALGKTAPPETIADLFITPIDEKSAELYWPQAVDLDVRVGGEIRIRHCPLTDTTASWGQSNDIVPAVPGSATRKIVPLLTGTYFVRAVDSLGNESSGTANVVVSLPAPQDALLIQQYREDTTSPPFQGTYTNMAYNVDEGGLVLTASALIDDMALDGNWDGLTSFIDYVGGSVTEGTYQYFSTLDLGAVYDMDLQAILQTRAFEPGNFMDDRLADMDDWDDIDGDDVGSVNTGLYVRATNNNPSSSPLWGDWQPFVNGTTRGRGFQFKMVANATNSAQNLVVSQLGVNTQFQRRTEQQRNITSGAGTYTVTFPSAFYDVPSIGITAQDIGTGGYFTITNTTRTGFEVTFRNGAGSIVSKAFDYMAVGHGRQIA